MSPVPARLKLMTVWGDPELFVPSVTHACGPEEGNPPDTAVA